MSSINRFIILLSFFAPSIIVAASEPSPQELTPSDLAQQYASQWFSIDSKSSVELIFSSKINGLISEPSDFEFTSDDGQKVNGRLAMPAPEYSGPAKLALLLHPMGLDQSFWWNEGHSMKASTIMAELRSNGYTVITLDARKHGARAAPGVGPGEVAQELIGRARSDEPRLYLDTIIGSVRDYRQVLAWAKARYQPTTTLVSGYSMGAQMSILLASYEPSIDHALIMVPPYIANENLPVTPLRRASTLTTKNLLWLAAEKDQYSTQEQTKRTFNLLASNKKDIVWFDSQHRLPIDYLESAKHFIREVSERGVE